MTKPKLWLKKRTSRGKNDAGEPRKVTAKPKLSAKNFQREVYKNQRWYSHFLLKFVICALLGLVWLRIGFKIPLLGYIFPLGFCVGLLVLALEKFAKYRLVELAILLVVATASFFWAIGIIL